MTATTPNQSYLCKQMQFRLAAGIAVLLQDLGYNVANHWSAYKENPGKSIFYPTGWRKDSQHFAVRPSGSRKASTVKIEFSQARWDGLQSDINYGPETLDHKVIENDEGKSKIVKNGTGGQLHVSYEESTSLTNSFSSSVTKGVTLDMTEETDASVDSSQTVSGEYAGVSAEVSLSEHFGISESRSQSKSTETGKEKAEEGTKEESLAIEFDAEPHTNYLVQITKENENTQQPFDIDGVMDFGITIEADNRYWQHTANSGHRPHGTVRIGSVDALLQFVHGYDTDHPSMAGYWAKAPAQVKHAIEWIAASENRRIQVSGTNSASLDSNADYEVKELGANVPPELAHLPEVNAQDVTG